MGGDHLSQIEQDELQAVGQLAVLVANAAAGDVSELIATASDDAKAGDP